MNLISEDYLMHYGVKGMKWGVRNDPQSTGRMRRRAANQQYRQSVKAAGRRNIQAFRENYGSREARRTANQQFRSEVNAAKQKNREAFKLSDKQKKILKGTAIAAGVIAAAGIGTIAVSNIKITNSAKKEVMTALKRTGSARVSEVLTNHNDSFVKNGEAAKFLHDKNLKESAKAVSNYHKRQIEKINTNANKIIERHEQSVPKKEINKEARSLVKEWRDVSRQNRKINRANNKLWKQYKRGKIDSRQYQSMFKPYKQRSNYKTPTNWYKYYPNDWI